MVLLTMNNNKIESHTPWEEICERFYIKTLLIRMGLNKRWLSWFWGGGTINKAVMFLVRISRKPSPDLSTINQLLMGKKPCDLSILIK